MASTKKKTTSGNNLATLLSVKQKLMAKNKTDSLDDPSKSMAVITTGAHSNERLKYRQMGAVETVPNQTKTPAANQPDPLKIGRNEKQLEIGLLDKKMVEIQKKQEQRTNEAADAWKAFETMNYGFGYNAAPPVQPTSTGPTNYINDKQTRADNSRQEPKLEQKPSPKSEELPSKKEATITKAEPTIEEITQNPDKTEISIPPTPAPRHSRPNTTRDVSQETKPQQQELFKTIQLPEIVNQSNQQVYELNIESFPHPSIKRASISTLKIFPDINFHRNKSSSNALKSIQRSMDRYRFYVW